jgi:hypothetical protein
MLRQFTCTLDGLGLDNSRNLNEHVGFTEARTGSARRRLMVFRHRFEAAQFPTSVEGFGWKLQSSRFKAGASKAMLRLREPLQHDDDENLTELN